MPRLHFRLPLDAARLLRARERIRDYLRLHCPEEQVIDDVVLCVMEACTNVIRHSGASGDMDVSLRFAGDELVVDVRDQGRGFDIRSFDRDRVPDLLADGGRGLYLIAHIMDEMDLEMSGGLHVHMAMRALPLICVYPRFEAGPGDVTLLGADEQLAARRRAMLEEVEEAFFAMDWEYRYVYVNSAATRLFGRGRGELIGRTPFEVWPAVIGTELEWRYREAMELGHPAVFERLSPVSGHWIETRVYPTPTGICAYLRQIDERKRVEADRERLLDELRDSERRYRATFEQAAVGMVHCDPEGRYFRVNQRFCELLGYTREELEAMSFQDVTDPADLPREQELIAALVAGEGTSYAMDKRYRRRDGSEVWTALTVSLVRDDAGRPDYLVGVVQDITARKRSEELLRRYELLWVEARDVMLYVRGSDGRIVEANRAAEAAYGYSREELLTRTIHDLRAGEAAYSLQQQLEAAAGAGLLFEALHRRKDGTVFPAEVSSRGITMIDGEQVLLNVIRDVSDRALLTSELAQERDALATVVANTDAQLVFLDRDFDFVLVSPAYAATCGYRPEEMVGLNYFELYPDAETEAIFRHVRDSGEAYRYQAKPFDQSAESGRGVTYWDWRLSAVHDAGGEVVGLVFSLVDVTERVRRAHYAEALTGLLERISAAYDEDHVVRLTGETVCETLGADAWRVWRHERDRWALLHSSGAVSPAAGWSVPAASAGLAMKAMESGAVEVFDAADAEAVGDKVAVETGVRSLIVAPLEPGGEPFTALFVGWVDRRRVITDAEREFVARATEAASAAVQSARLYEELAARERYGSALNDISASIASTLDYDEILDRVVGLAAQAIGAESSSISLLEGGLWVPRYLWQVPHRFQGVPVPVDSIPYAALAAETREVVAVDDSETHPRVDRELQRAWGVRSVMIAPLVVRNEPVAGIFFNYHSGAHAFSPLEKDFAAKVAAIISGALQNARVYEAERRIASTLQENFIHPLPRVEGLEFAVTSQTAYEPELIGGDFHDAFPVDDGCVAVLVGDVEGKGVRAAGLTETVRSAVRTAALTDSSPAYILGKANDLLLSQEMGQFVTAALVVVDPRTGEARMASAGHPPALLITAAGVEEAEVEAGVPLGSFPWRFADARLELSPDDVVLLYTDGLTETRRDGEQFGAERAAAYAADLRGAALDDLLAGLLTAAVDFGGELRDDVQLVAFRVAR